MRKNNLKLVSWGREKFESTSTFKDRVVNIKKEVHALYADALLQENNNFKRTWLQIKIVIEIRKRIYLVSSSRNLHIANSWAQAADSKENWHNNLNI